MPPRRVYLPIAGSPRAPSQPPENPARDRHGRLTMAAARAVAGAVGHPSKMPGYSYGISATRCITGGKLRSVAGAAARRRR